MVHRNIILGLFLVLLLGIFISLSSKVNSNTLNSCGTNSTIIDSMLGDPLFLYDDFDPVIDVALQAECSTLETGTCGFGACEDGWKCMDTGTQCLCSPPE